MHGGDDTFAFGHLFSAASYAPLPVPPPFEEFRAEDFKFTHEDFLDLNISSTADAFSTLDAFNSLEYADSLALAQPANENEEPLLNQLEQRFFSEFLDTLVLDQNYSLDPQGIPPNLPVLSSVSAIADDVATTAEPSDRSRISLPRMMDGAMEEAEVFVSPAARKRKVGIDSRVRSSTNGGKNEDGPDGYYDMRFPPRSSPSVNGNGTAGAGSTSPSHNMAYSGGAPLSPSPPYSPSFPNSVPAKRKSEQGSNPQGYARRKSNAEGNRERHHVHSRDAVGSNTDGISFSASTAPVSSTQLPRRLSFSDVTPTSNGLSVEPIPFTPFATAVSIIRENGSVILPRPARFEAPEHAADGTENRHNHKNSRNDDGDSNHSDPKTGKLPTLPSPSSPASAHQPPSTVRPLAISKHPPGTVSSESLGVSSEPQTPATSNAPTSVTKGRKEKEKKPPKELLTEEEKRANHIASEQKRRNTIRAGFKDLTEIVPRLRDVNNSKSTILFKAVDFIHHLRQRNSTLRNIASDLEIRLKLASAASMNGGQHRQQPTTLPQHHVDNGHISHSHPHTHPHTNTPSIYCIRNTT